MKLGKAFTFACLAFGCYYTLCAIGQVYNLSQKERETERNEELHKANIDAQEAFKEHQNVETAYTTQQAQHDNIWFIKRMSDENPD